MKLRERSSGGPRPTAAYASDFELEEDGEGGGEHYHGEEDCGEGGEHYHSEEDCGEGGGGGEHHHVEEDDGDGVPDEDCSSQPSSDDPPTVVVVNPRRRKVQLRRAAAASDSSSPESEKKNAKTAPKEPRYPLGIAHSLLRYAQPNVRDTDRGDACVASPVDRKLCANTVVEDSDEDFVEAGKHARRKKKEKKEGIGEDRVDVQAVSVGVKSVARIRSVPKKSYREVSSEGESEDEDDDHPSSKSAGSLHDESENAEASQEDSENAEASQEKSSITPPDLSIFSFKQETSKHQSVKRAEAPRKVSLSQTSRGIVKRSLSSSVKCKTHNGKDGNIRGLKQVEEEADRVKGVISNTVPSRQSSRLAERSEPAKCLKDESSDDDDDSIWKVGKHGTLPDKEKELPESNCLKSGDQASYDKNLEVEKDDVFLGSVAVTSRKLEVDKYGLKISNWSSSMDRVMKRVGDVERILSVRNRGADSELFCVKEHGKSYRNVVLVKEKLLREKCPQLLRNFLKKLDELGKSDGNTGEGDNGYAFDPLYLKIDRIFALEERKNGRKYYLVKWRGLAYSESSWEAKEDLTFEGDEDAVARFSAINCPRDSRMFQSLSFGKLIFRDGRVFRDYQEKGLEWMDHNFQNRLNCILADEMGLGKTMQAVSMLQNLRVKRRMKGPFLVIAPVSTLGHWQREVETLTDMNCVAFSGSAKDRDIIKEYEFYYPKTKRVKFHVLLTSFEILMKDQSFLCKQDWEYVIVDEAHRLKSKDSKTTRSLKQLKLRKGGLLLLTGTPVQNNMKEIFGLLNVLDSDQFDSEFDFLSKYGDLKNAEQVKDLQDNILKPRLLRRLKEDVEKSIPLKEETIIWVELTKEQRCYYKAIMENRISELLKGSQSSNMPNLRNIAMELRKLCNHPFLCNGLKEDLDSRLHPNKKILDHDDKEDTAKALCLASGKMLLLDKLLPMLKSSGHRVLIFSQFAIMLDVLENYLLLRNHSYERIDGSVRGSERQAAIDRYSEKDSDTFIFLLSTRAGGLGITLTAADTCIIYDSDWNPQNDLQAMARCHRIGQKKDVRIYRLITRNTYEQHLFECSSRKYGLDEAILGSMQETNHTTEYNENIENLLKKGAYSLLREDGEAESAAFHAQNIEQILESRTEKRLIGGRGNNTFSVATFVSNPDASTQNPDVDDNPTQSWQDLLPEACANVVNGVKHEELPCGPRKRLRVNYKERKGVSDHESLDDEYENPKGKRHAAKKNQQDKTVSDGIKHWTEKEIRQLETCLVRLGRNRTEQIMIEAGVSHHSMEEVQHLCDVLIKLWQHCHSKTSNVLNNTAFITQTSEKSERENYPPLKLEDNPSECKNNGWNASTFNNQHPNGSISSASDGKHADVQNGDGTRVSDSTFMTDGKHLSSFCEFPVIPVYAQKVMSSEIFMSKLEKRATRNIQTLKERDILARIVQDGSIIRPIYPRRSRNLPPWWKNAEDADLLLGAYKHGHRDFDKIRKDATLCFSKRFESSKNAVHHEVEISAENAAEIKIPKSEEAGCQNKKTEDAIAWPNDSLLTSRLKKLIEYIDTMPLMPEEDMEDECVSISHSEPILCNGTTHQQNVSKQNHGNTVLSVSKEQSDAFKQKDELNLPGHLNVSSETSLKHCRQKTAKRRNHKWPNVVYAPNSASESEDELIIPGRRMERKSSLVPVMTSDATMQEKKVLKRSECCTKNFVQASNLDNELRRGKENNFVLSFKTNKSKEVESVKSKASHMGSSPLVAKRVQPGSTTGSSLQQGIDSPILKVNIDALKRKVSLPPSSNLPSKKAKQGGKQQTLLRFLSTKCEKQGADR